MKKGNTAFTLAEVLITLGVIGVLAALTIPTLIAKQQKAAALSQLKKSYAMIQTMYQKIVAENGSLEEWGWDPAQNYDTVRLDYVFRNMIAPNLRVTRYCDGSDDGAACWPQGKGMNGSDVSDNIFVAAILADGSSILFRYYRNVSENIYQMIINVDFNGPKSPNTYGKDRFSFYVDNISSTRGKIVPYGTNFGNPDSEPRDPSDCWENESGTPGFWPGTGLYCAFTIIRFDKWQIRNDYPW